MESNAPNAVLSLFLLLQLSGALVFALAGLYVLYCLNRAASGLDRMADVAEAWLLMQQHQMQQQAQQEAQQRVARPQNLASTEAQSVVIEKANLDSQNL